MYFAVLTNFAQIQSSTALAVGIMIGLVAYTRRDLPS